MEGDTGFRNLISRWWGHACLNVDGEFLSGGWLWEEKLLCVFEMKLRRGDTEERVINTGYRERGKEEEREGERELMESVSLRQ